MSFILSLVFLEAVGILAVLLILKRHAYTLPFLVLLSLSFFVGAGFINCQFFIYYLLGIKFGFWNSIFIPFLCLLFSPYYAFRIYKNRKASINIPENTPRWNIFEKILSLFVLFQICRVFFITWPVPVNSYDALWSYALKAKIFYLHGGIPEGFFNWGNARVGHADYPLLLPFLMLWIYKFTGFNDLIVVRIMPIMFLFILVLLFFQLKNLFGRKPALFGIFIISTIPQIANYATIIHADLVLFCYITSAFLYFALYVRHFERKYLVLSSLIFAFSLYVKNEAIIFSGAFVTSLLIYLLRTVKSNRIRLVSDMLTPLLIISIVAGPWLLFKTLNHIENSDLNLSGINYHSILGNIKDIPVLLNEFQKQVFGPKKWNIFWIMVIAIMAINYKKLFKGELFYITLFLLFSVAGYFVAFMSVTGNTLFFYANKTMSRFMIHFTGLFLVLSLFVVHETEKDR